MDCVKKKHFFTRGISLWSYDQSVKQAVYRFKYKNQRCYAAYFARELIHHYYPVMKAWNAQAILPVPIHKKRYRQRGYNQAELIAKELAEYLQIPVDNGRIRRVKNTRPQKELNDMQRHKNLKNAFHMVKNSVELKRVIIVDDIYTTGATVDAMAELLWCAGAEKIYVVTLCIGKGY